MQLTDLKRPTMFVTGLPGKGDDGLSFVEYRNPYRLAEAIVTTVTTSDTVRLMDQRGVGVRVPDLTALMLHKAWLDSMRNLVDQASENLRNLIASHPDTLNLDTEACSPLTK